MLNKVLEHSLLLYISLEAIQLRQLSMFKKRKLKVLLINDYFV